MAALGMHLAVLQWLHANGCPWDWCSVRFYATENGHKAARHWACANGCAEGDVDEVSSDEDSYDEDGAAGDD
jgi:hypothetical protein